jgi:glyoxylase-like metal-dependent hydrolase (beta-lactamase superfamily II)
MNPHYIPPKFFPMVLTPRIRVLGNYFFNLFLVTGSERSALFETGISGVVDTVIQQLDELGIAPDYLVVSHPHSDHITGLPGLMERFPGATIVCGGGAPEFVSHPKAGPALIREDKFMSRGLERMGIKPGRPTLESIPDLSRAKTVDSPALLDLGGGTGLSLTPVEGHSPGNLIAEVKEDRALFCSDSMGFHYPGRQFWPLFFTGAKVYLETIDLIEAANPAILAPAHQGPIMGDKVHKGIDLARTTALDIIKRIRGTELSDDELAGELFEESYRDEFTLYTRENIMNCTRLLLKRAREMA